jgi:hypothetical protein
MSTGELTEVIAAVASPVVTLGLAYIGYLKLKATTASKSDVAQVHTLVNNQLDQQLRRNDQLTRALTAGGVTVPSVADDERMATPGNGVS